MNASLVFGSRHAPRGYDSECKCECDCESAHARLFFCRFSTGEGGGWLSCLGLLWLAEAGMSGEAGWRWLWLSGTGWQGQTAQVGWAS